MPDARKKPCCICRRWFRPDPRIGSRQRACRNPDCQSARQKKMQRRWRERNPDYFIARRIQDRGKEDRLPEPLRLPPPLNRLPWDIAQSEFESQGADFIGVMGALLLRTAQLQFRAYLADLPRLADTLPPASAQSPIAPVGESPPFGAIENEAGVFTNWTAAMNICGRGIHNGNGSCWHRWRPRDNRHRSSSSLFRINRIAIWSLTVTSASRLSNNWLGTRLRRWSGR